MATLHPFTGLRFPAEPASALSHRICPPYDVISPEQQAALYDSDPHNAIRLELPREVGPARYAGAAATFAEWRVDGILRPELAPAFYVYQQRFTAQGVTHVRRGVFAGLQLEPWSTGRVLPHEETFPSHKADRMQMLTVCQANFSPIFGLVEDPDGAIQTLLAEVAETPPVADFDTDEGHRHTLWPVTDPAVNGRLAALAEPWRIFIADGHHRYETALEYRSIRRSADPSLPPRHGVDDLLAYIVPLGDPGLVVLPTHRLLPTKGGGDRLLERLLDAARPAFDLREVALDGSPRTTVTRYFQELEANREPIRFGAYAGSDRPLIDLILRERTPVDAVMPPGVSAAWAGLDVAVLHRFLLQHGLGLGTGEAAGLIYTRDEQFAVDAVDRGEAAVAIFVRPATPDQVKAVALAGERMPEKSTYFYPKVPTGLVIRALDLA